MAKVGSIKVQFSKTEKGFVVSKVGAGIFPRISSILSLGRASSLEIRLVLQVEGGGRVELNSTVFGSDKEGTGAWSVSRGVDTLAAIGVVAGFEGAIESGLWREAFGVGEI